MDFSKLYFGKVEPRPLVEEMRQSYLDYSMSVIVSRALPDVRDGLKPVHRRILYAMWGLGLRASGKHRKSATVVGEVLGKYHPHGDTAVYDSMARMAQDFSMRTLLVDGQGNFGSVDGDSPAAMRYTEAKLTKAAEEILFDLDKDTVEWQGNYDNTQQEPTVMPAKLPNLLLNGTVGIAVGMATSIPPHNLSELCDATSYLVDNPDATTEDLMEFVKGPDFPTGGAIFDKNEIAHAYATGHGGIVMRAKAEIVEEKDGQFRIVVTEIPYMVNKTTLLEKIAELVRDKRIDGIRDLRDESDKDGLRIVIELKRDAFPKKVLNRLFVLTPLQEKFSVNLLALVDRGRQPQVMTLVSILQAHIDHRQEVIRRRTQFELKRAEERAHILEGLMIAHDAIDAVIKLIRASNDRETAHKGLMSTFKLSDLQANAILDMRLSQLAALERLKIETELAEKRVLIAALKGILADPKKILNIIKADLAQMQDLYGDERRTQVFAGPVGEFSAEDLIPDEQVIITITEGNYIKALPIDTYKVQGRGGKGVIGMGTKEEDVVQHFFTTSTHADVLFFTSQGRVFRTKAYEIPKSSRTAKGNSIVNFLQLAQGETVAAALPMEKLAASAKYLTMVTRQGTIKRTALEEFGNVRRSGLIALTIHDADELAWVRPTSGSDEILIASSAGQAIRFPEDDVRAMGRGAAGVIGMRLKNKDTVVGMEALAKGLAKETPLLVITRNGYGKQTPIEEYRLQGRGGSGIRTANVTSKNGPVVSARMITDAEAELVVISKMGQVIRLPVSEVPNTGRATIGVRVMRMNAGDAVSSVTCIEGEAVAA